MIEKITQDIVIDLEPVYYKDGKIVSEDIVPVCDKDGVIDGQALADFDDFVVNVLGLIHCADFEIEETKIQKKKQKIMVLLLLSNW